MLYLASTSPRRSDILREFSVPFQVIPNCLFEEYLNPYLGVREAVRRLALQKATASQASWDGMILGVDTIVVVDDVVFGKPVDREDAARMIGQLQGRTHQVISAFGMVDTGSGKTLSRSDVAMVTFRSMSQSEMNTYAQRDDIMDKAGAYGIQDSAAGLISKIHGSRYTVMGLPIRQLLPILRQYGIV